VIRTYPLKHDINKGKEKKIIELQKEYQYLAHSISNKQWEEFYKEGKFNKDVDIKSIETKLSERYKQTCQYQVVGMLNSFISNRQKEFIRIVHHSNVSEEVKVKLFYINKYEKWFRKEVKMQGKLIEEEIIKLSRKIIKEVISCHRRPSCKNINLALDSKVAKISGKEESNNQKGSHFDYWIKLSTLEKGNPIYLPLLTNEYFESKKGERKNFCQINIDREGKITVCLIKNVEEKKDYIPRTPQIAFDIGIRNLISTNNGDIYGRDFIEPLMKYDEILNELAQNRQRQGLPVRCKKYDSIVNKIRKYLKNEIHRIIKVIIKQYEPEEIIIEHLNFTSPKLSKRLNRIISRFGKSIIKECLNSINEEYGIIISEINPAYTSQTCSVCGYVDKENRESQSKFVCKYCNKKMHADVNASRNTLSRSSNKKLSSIYISKDKILEELVMQFLERHSGVYSYAHRLLVSNPYFNGLRDKRKILL
jgi:putative transposase